MKLVVDANVIFSALIGGKLTEIFLSPKLELFVPELLFVEIKKHEEEIKQKSCFSDKEFELLLGIIEKRVKVVPLNEFIYQYKEAKELLKEHSKDAPYVALALYLGCPFWSYEKRFQKIKEIECITTEEIVKLTNK